MVRAVRFALLFVMALVLLGCLGVAVAQASAQARSAGGYAPYQIPPRVPPTRCAVRGPR